jgi:hypothetical protein
MKSLPFRLTLVGVLSLGTCASALAQSWYPSYTSAQPQYGAPSGVNPQDQAQYDARQRQYQQSQQDYQSAQDQYRSQQDQYWSQRNQAAARQDAYDARRTQYDYDRDAYEAQRAQYDAEYGAGAWERRYGYTVRDRGGYDYYRSSPCERRASSGAVAGGVIGALAGAAIGSSIAGRGNHTTGAVVGAVAGGAIGAAAGSSAAQCDSTGYYFSYNDTYPYRVTGDSDSDGRYGYDYYVSHRCRLAVAPAYVDGSVDNRYVRVCPDRYGRYRITS